MLLSSHRLPVSAALLAAGIVAQTTCAAPASFTISLDAGETMAYSLQQSMTVHNGDQETVIGSRFDYAFDVETADEDGADLAATVSRVGMNMSQGGITAAFDSAEETPAQDASGGQLAATLKPLVGAGLKLHVAQDGEVSIIDDTAIRDNPIASQLLNPEMQKESLSRIFRIDGAPEEVNPGDTWTVSKTQQLDAAISVLFTHTYTVEEVSDDVVKVSLKGDAEMQEMGPEIPAEQRPEMTVHEISGSISWDRKAGALNDYQYVADFTIAGMNPQLGQRVSARLKQDQTLNRIAD